MLLKLIIFLIFLMLFAGSYVNLTPSAAKKHITDDTLIITDAMLDKALMRYWRRHSGKLPAVLDAAALKELGVGNLKPEQMIYTPGSNSYSLKIQLQDGAYTTPQSDKILPDMP